MIGATCSVNVGDLAAEPAPEAGSIRATVTADAAAMHLSVIADLPDAQDKDFVFRNLAMRFIPLTRPRQKTKRQVQKGQRNNCHGNQVMNGRRETTDGHR